MNLGKQIKKYKKFKHWSSMDLAIHAGVSYHTVEYIIRNGDCKLSTAKRIADALEITLDQLVADQ